MEDYHLTYRSVLRQQLALDTDVCLQLGAKATTASPLKRKQELSVEKMAKPKPLNSISQKPKAAQGPKYQKSAKKNWLLAEFQKRLKMLKGNKCTKVKSHPGKKASCGPSMEQLINKAPCEQRRENVTSHQNIKSGTKDLKRKQCFDVPEPCGGFQSTPPKPIPGSTDRTSEVPMAKKLKVQDHPTARWFEHCRGIQSVPPRPIPGSTHRTSEVPMVKKFTVQDPPTPRWPEPCSGSQSVPPRQIPVSTHCTSEVPMADKFRVQAPPTPQWPEPCEIHLSRTAVYSSCSSEVSRPFPIWQQKEIEQMKRNAQHERQQAARITKRGLDRNFLITRTDQDLDSFFRELNNIYLTNV